jgi:hypothetical protein
MNLRLVLLIAIAAAGCDRLPRDPDGTTERVTAERRFRVGAIAGAAGPSLARQQALLHRVGAALGARAEIETGSGEALLLRLEEGALDLVVGEFDSKSPWVGRVHLLPPLLRVGNGGGETHVGAATRHGENRWIMLLDREARALGAVS